MHWGSFCLGFIAFPVVAIIVLNVAYLAAEWAVDWAMKGRF